MFKVAIPKDNDEDRIYNVYNRGEYILINEVSNFIETIDETFDIEFLPLNNKVAYLLKTKVPTIVCLNDIESTFSKTFFSPVAISDSEYNKLYKFHKLQWPDKPDEVKEDLNTVKKLIKTPNKIKKETY